MAGVSQGITIPAAGADFSITDIPAGFKWRVLSFSCSFTASAQVANRLAEVVLDTTEGADPLCTTPPFPAITAGQSRNIRALAGYPLAIDSAFDTNNNCRAWIHPGLWLYAGTGRIRTLTANIQTLDQWASNPNLYVEELPVGG